MSILSERLAELEHELATLRTREEALETERISRGTTIAALELALVDARVRLGETERLLRMPVRGGKGQMGVRGRAAQWFRDRDRYFAGISRAEQGCEPGCGDVGGEPLSLLGGDYSFVKGDNRQWCSIDCLNAGRPLRPARHDAETKDQP